MCREVHDDEVIVGPESDGPGAVARQQVVVLRPFPVAVDRERAHPEDGLHQALPQAEALAGRSPGSDDVPDHVVLADESLDVDLNRVRAVQNNTVGQLDRLLEARDVTSEKVLGGHDGSSWLCIATIY
jgi:hypothetical protein